MKFISLLCHLEDRKVVLASQSPRRIELLKNVGLSFEVYPAQIEEGARGNELPAEYVRHMATEKAHWVARRTSADLIIAADTVVTLNGRIYEKPLNHSEAEKMLRELSDNTHHVITGFCMLYGDKVLIDHEETAVTFYPLSDHEIEMYLQSDEPFDKAGAYGIQGFASLFIRKIDGCYFNVVGFPLGKFYQQLKKLLSVQ
ncbi:MAG: Maf family protein [Calditrichia bacterium]